MRQLLHVPLSADLNTVPLILQVLLDVSKKTCTRIMNDQTVAWPSARFAHAACTLHSLAGHDMLCVYGGLGAESDSTAWHIWDPHAHI